MQSYTIDLDADRVNVEETGEGPILLCLPGLGGGAWFFREFAECLKDRFRILSVDLPGGRPFSLQGCSRVMNRLCETFPQNSVTLLGHSMSAMLALLINEMNPSRLRSLVLVGGLPKVTENIYQKLSLRTGEIRERGMAGMGNKIVSGVFSRNFRQSRPELVSDFSARMEALPPALYLNGIEELLAADMWNLVPIVKIPCLVLTGSEDQYAPPKLARNFATSLGASTVFMEMEGCGHMPFMEKPMEMALAVSNFLVNLS